MKGRFLKSLTIASTLVVGTLGSQVFSNSANAASLSYTAGYLDPSGTPTNTQYDNEPVTPPLPQFNPALGTLKSVTISYTANANFSGTVKSFDPKVQTYSQQLDGVAVFNVGPLGNPVLPVPSTTIQASLPPVVNAPIAPGQTIPVGPTTATASGGPITITPSDADLNAAGFIGTSYFPAFLSGLASTTFNASSGNILGQVTTTVGGNITLTYNYDEEVPEPSDSVGVLLALGGLGFLKFIKIKQS